MSTTKRHLKACERSWLKFKRRICSHQTRPSRRCRRNTLSFWWRRTIRLTCSTELWKTGWRESSCHKSFTSSILGCLITMGFYRKIKSKLSKRSETLTKSKLSRKKLMLPQKKWKKLKLYGANYRPWSQILMRIERPRSQSLRWRRPFNKPWIHSKTIMMTKLKENGIWPKFNTQPSNPSFSLGP